MNPEQRTIDHRNNTRVDYRDSSLVTWYCGCELRREKIWSCLFHQGYQAALDQHAPLDGKL
jgi:hypothetical protein